MKKRGKKEEVFLNVNGKTFQRLWKNLQKGVDKNVRFLNYHLEVFKKSLTNVEEPYCEISQSYKAMKIKVELPGVKKKDIKLNLYNDKMELKAETKIRDADKNDSVRIFYRSIDLPSCSMIKKAKAEFKRDNLKVHIPFKKIEKN